MEHDERRDAFYNVSMEVSFEDMKVLRLVSSMFEKLYDDNYFWHIKALRDFGLDDRLYKILSDGLIGRESYIKIAALYNIPVNGSLRYGNKNKLYDALSKHLPIDIDTIIEYTDNDAEKMCPVIRHLIVNRKMKIVNYVSEHYPYSQDYIDDCIIAGVAYIGDSKLFFDLVKNVTDVSASVFINSTIGGNLDIVKWVVDNIKNLQLVFHIGLENAVEYRRLDVVRYLLTKKIGRGSLAPVLRKAAEKGYVEFIEPLMNAGITDVNYALEGSGNIKVFDKLVSLGATNFAGALYNAASSGNYEMVKHILNVGKEKKSRYFRGAFSAALGNGGNITLIKEIPNLDVDRVLVGAIRKDRVEVVKYFDPTPDILQELAKHAAYHASKNVIYYMIENGVIFTTEHLRTTTRSADIKLFASMYEHSINPDDSSILYDAKINNNLQVIAYMKNK